MNNIIKKIRWRSILFLAVIIYLSVSLISAQFELMTVKQEYENINMQKERLALQVEETQAMLDEEDHSIYIERIAREKLGYANPGEKVFVDAQAE